MLASYATGLVAVVLMMLAWVGVMSAWRRAFPEASSDPDVLAGRPSCHGCTGQNRAEGACERHRAGSAWQSDSNSSACKLEKDRNHGRAAAEEDTP